MRWLRPDLSRRAVLGLGATAVISGCLPGRRAKPPVGPNPDAGLAASVRSAEAGLLAAYDAAIRGFPALAGVLVPLRDEHEQHLSALSGRRPGGAPSGQLPATPSAPLPATPATEAGAAVRSLVAAERAAAAARIADCLAAASPSLAGLLASIGASEAAHAAALAVGRLPR